MRLNCFDLLFDFEDFIFELVNSHLHVFFFSFQLVQCEFMLSFLGFQLGLNSLYITQVFVFELKFCLLTRTNLFRGFGISLSQFAQFGLQRLNFIFLDILNLLCVLLFEFSDGHLVTFNSLVMFFLLFNTTALLFQVLFSPAVDFVTSCLNCFVLGMNYPVKIYVFFLHAI